MGTFFDHDALEQQYAEAQAQQQHTPPECHPTSLIVGRITPLGVSPVHEYEPGPFALEAVRAAERKRLIEQDLGLTPYPVVRRDPRQAFLDRVRAIRDRLKDAGAPRQDPVVAAVHAILDLLEIAP